MFEDFFLTSKEWELKKIYYGQKSAARTSESVGLPGDCLFISLHLRIPENMAETMNET
jgi:hypothetical protein